MTLLDPTLLNPDLVKISHFTRQGFSLRGVVHVGANDGYEIQFYLHPVIGCRHVLAIEPLAEACSVIREDWSQDPRVRIIQSALGNIPALLPLAITQGDGQGSSFLPEIRPHNPSSPYEIVERRTVPVQRFDQLVDQIHLDLRLYDCLVIDVQGMELAVLEGMGQTLGPAGHFDYLNIELSREPLYEGGVPAQQVVDWLRDRGFDQDSPIESHDDVMFVRRGLKPAATT